MELEGLVTIIPNKGAYVSGITPKDVHDIYMYEVVCWKGLCARWATEYITPEQISRTGRDYSYCQNFIPSRKIRVNAQQVTNLDGQVSCGHV